MLTGICCVAWTLGHWAGEIIYIGGKMCTSSVARIYIGWRESLTFSIALLGKCSVAASFAVIYLFTAELFPTQVRYYNTLSGTLDVSMCLISGV